MNRLKTSFQNQEKARFSIEEHWAHTRRVVCCIFSTWLLSAQVYKSVMAVKCEEYIYNSSLPKQE